MFAFKNSWETGFNWHGENTLGKTNYSYRRGMWSGKEENSFKISRCEPQEKNLKEQDKDVSSSQKRLGKLCTIQ